MHFMNEEGDMLEGCDAEDLDAGNNAVQDDLGVVEDGFEDVQLDVSGFATEQFNIEK